MHYNADNATSCACRLVSLPLSGTLEAHVAQLLRKKEPTVLVTIVNSHGSSPRHTGTRALQTRYGFEGTVGGGHLEAQAMQTARQCLSDGQSRCAFFSLDASSTQGDVVCGGTMEIFCEVLTQDQADMFSMADTLLYAGKQGIWTITRTMPKKCSASDICNLKRCLHVDMTASPVVPGCIADLEYVWPWLEQLGDHSGLLKMNDDIVYIEPLDAPPVLLLCGGGHVSLEVAKLAHACGFIVDVVDDRPEFANAERFPMARHCLALPGFANLAAACGLGPFHFVAIMTRGHAFDRQVLEQVLAHPVRYVGMIGSKTKKAHVYAALRAAGVSDTALATVCCPIGLKFKAETPQQIAVSVVAELLAAKGGVLPTLRPAS